MRRVVFFIDDFRSHVFASMGLARRLLEHQCKVEFWGSPYVATIANEQGFPYQIINRIRSRYPMELDVKATGLFNFVFSAVSGLRKRRAWACSLSGETRACEAEIDTLLR